MRGLGDANGLWRHQKGTQTQDRFAARRSILVAPKKDFSRERRERVGMRGYAPSIHALLRRLNWC